MRISEMTGDQIRHLALKLNDSGKMPLAKMEPYAALCAGNFYAWAARAEECKPYWKAAKKDKRDRDLGLKFATNEFCGEFGRVKIGGRMFTYYPHSDMIIRDDFATWCEAHFGDYFFPTGNLRKVDRPERQADVEVDAQLHMWKDIRARVQKLNAKVHEVYPVQAWHEEFTMRHDLQTLVGAFEDCLKQGELFPLLKCDCDLLAAKIAYRQKKFGAAKEHLLNLAAAAMRTALLVQEKHGAKEGCEA